MEQVGGSGIYHYVLYSDGSINDGVGKIPTQWTLDKNNLLIVYQLPEGVIKDTCTIESFGQ